MAKQFIGIAADNGGELLRFNSGASQWELHPNQPPSIAGSSVMLWGTFGNYIAFMDSTHFRYWNGSTWNSILNGIGGLNMRGVYSIDDPTAIYFSSDGAVFVGDAVNGTLNNIYTSSFNNGSNGGVYAASATDVWSVGGSGGQETVDRWDGSIVTNVFGQMQADLGFYPGLPTCIIGFSANEVYIGTNSGLFILWNGSVFSQVNGSQGWNLGPNSAWGLSSSNIWASPTSSKITYFNGAPPWVDQKTGLPGNPFLAGHMHGISNTEIMAKPTNSNTELSLDGSTWTTITGGPNDTKSWLSVASYDILDEVFSPPTPTSGDPARAPIGSLFVDNVQLDSVTTDPVICCRIPVPNQTGVAVDSTIDLTILDLEANGWTDDAKIWVTTNSVTTLIYDQSINFTEVGWSVIDTLSQSPGSGVDDVNRFVISHTTDFISEETVTVRVTATTGTANSLDETYTFNVADVVQPHLLSAKPFGIRTVRVEFTEPMQADNELGSSLCVENISGRVSFIAPDIIECPVANFVSDHVNLFVGVAGARNALNNGTHEILTVLSSTRVQVNSVIVTEGPADPKVDKIPQVRLSCYRFLHIPPTDPDIIEPAFEPIVLSAALPSTLSVAPGIDVRTYVDLTLQDDLTPLVDYKLEAREILDLSGNEIGSEIDFTSWSPFAVADRAFDLFEMIPEMNRREDITKDMERLVRSIDETAQVTLFDVDQFGLLKDSDSTKENVLDVLLDHLGNPLPFTASLELQKKRDLIPLLVPMYKQKGTADGIIDITLFFLGPNVSLVRVLPFFTPFDSWILGESELGIDTILSPAGGFLRYAFEVEVTSDEPLTTEEKDIITDIVEFVRPAHTHFVRLIEIVI